jgi:hypothetical protein
MILNTSIDGLHIYSNKPDRTLLAFHQSYSLRCGMNGIVGRWINLGVRQLLFQKELDMKKHLAHLIIAVAAFSVGSLATVLWSIMHLHSDNPQRLKVENSRPRLPLATPKGWQKLVADDKVSFSLPLGMKMEKDVGTDSYLRAYTSKSMDVVVEYGVIQISGEQEGQEIPSEEIEIDGRKGILRIYNGGICSRYWKVVEVYVPDVGKDKQQFKMMIVFYEEMDLALAKQIFSTVQFQ